MIKKKNIRPIEPSTPKETPGSPEPIVPQPLVRLNPEVVSMRATPRSHTLSNNQITEEAHSEFEPIISAQRTDFYAMNGIKGNSEMRDQSDGALTQRRPSEYMPLTP